jgi:hypothetical protein
MKSIHKSTIYCLVAAGVVLIGCKLPSHHFVSPTLNHTAYPQQGAAHLGLQFGTIGLGMKGGIALSDRISVNGFLGGIPETKDDYTSREAEVSIGMQTKSYGKAVTSLFLGMGMGHNEKDITGLAGKYNRPFLQVQRGVFDRKISRNMYVDASGGLRINYLLYNGVNEGVNFDHNVFYTEPYVAVTVGGRNVRLQVLQGAAVKTSGTWKRGLRVFPYVGNVGLHVKWPGR